MTHDYSDSGDTLLLPGVVNTPEMIRRQAIDATIDGEFDHSVVAEVQRNLALMYLEEFNSGYSRICEMATKKTSPRVERLLRIAHEDEASVNSTVNELRKSVSERFQAIDVTSSRNFEKRGRVLEIVKERILAEQRERERRYLEEEYKREKERLRQEEAQRQLEENQRRAEEELRKEQERIKLEKERMQRALEEERRAEAAAKEAALKAAAEAEKERQRKLEQERLEAEKKRQEEALRKEEEQKKLAATKAEAEAREKAFTSWSDVKKEFNHYKSIIQEMKDLTVKTKQNKPLKNFCFEKRMLIRPKIGQITTSKRHVIQIANEMDEILTASKNENPDAYRNIMNAFAKMVVKQAEVEVVSNVQQAVPLGFMVAMVLEKHPEVKDIVIARFVKRAPQVIGYSCAIDTDELRKDMGWRKDKDDPSKWEPESKYLDKISGITQLWAAINLASVRNVSQSYPIANSWRFLARQLNKQANQTADYYAVAAWWEITARDFAQFYGKQGQKLLRLVVSSWAARKNCAASKRLQIIGEDWQSSGKIEAAWEDLTA